MDIVVEELADAKTCHVLQCLQLVYIWAVVQDLLLAIVLCAYHVWCVVEFVQHVLFCELVSVIQEEQTVEDVNVLSDLQVACLIELLCCF